MEEFSPFTEKNTDPKSATYSFNPSCIIGFRGVPLRERGRDPAEVAGERLIVPAERRLELRLAIVECDGAVADLEPPEADRDGLRGGLGR